MKVLQIDKLFYMASALKLFYDNLISKSIGKRKVICFTTFFNLIRIYNVNGSQFPQLEELIFPGVKPATFRYQLTAASRGIRTRPTGQSDF